MTEEAGVATVLEERPDLEPALESVLAVDEDHETWTFDDLSIESGPFGELVSRGVVESRDGGYRLADPDAVRAALRGESSAAAATESPDVPTGGVDLPTLSLPTVDGTTAALVGGALLFVALVRAISIGDVYRGGDVVLAGNDPYFYRYWVEQVATGSATAFDLGALDALPNAVTHGEPLTVATLWWIAELLGSGADTVGHVLAWYPVVSAVVTAGLVYLLAVRVTDDRRVGLAAILVLAILPGHALRTSLGYADHHAFDYPLLAATALVLVVLATTERDRLTAPSTLLASLGLGVSVSAQVLAWEAGPLLVAPLGLVVATRALVDVRSGRSPLVAGAPVVAGLTVAAVLTWAVHAGARWHTDVVASAPTLLLVGSVLALGVATAVHRSTGDVRHLLVADLIAVGGGVAVVSVALPDAWATLVERLAFLFGSHAAVETHSLLDPSSLDFVFLFGLALVLALPMMAVAVRVALDDGRWLVATVYGWYFFALAAIQVRFVGELGAFASLFAGLGLVRLAAWVDLADPVEVRARAKTATARASQSVRPLRVPDRRTVGMLLVLFLVFGALGGVQTGIKIEQVSTEDATYETAVEIREFATERGQVYPDDYVLSRWGYNRVYNYVVNGESRSYAYAQDTYVPFITAESPDGWYEQLRGRVGYVVLEPQNSPPASMHARLFDAYGSRTGEFQSLEHYRAMYVHESGDRAAFALVPGATIEGRASPNTTFTIATNVRIPGESFTYQQQGSVKQNGLYRVHVPYPGEYRFRAAGETRTVTVPERAVWNGTTIDG